MTAQVANKGPAEIENSFNSLDQDRRQSLDRARHFASLTKPGVLPPIHFANSATDTDKLDLPKRYQSTGSRGVTNMVGRMLLALWPPGVSWYKFDPTPSLKYHASQMMGDYDEALRVLDNILFSWELIIQANLDSTSLELERYQRNSRFRTAKRASLEQLIVTGDTLEYMADDFRIRVFRRDRYVTQRDSCGDVLYHVVRENIDPKTLSEDMVATAQLGEKASEKDPAKRLTDMFTRVMWQPDTKVWLIEQEMNGHIVNTSEEPITPYFSTAFNLMGGENYGRGFIEDIEGDLNSHNELRSRLLDFAAMASDKKLVLDQNSVTRPEDMEKPSGSVIPGRVRGGKWEDGAWTGVEHPGDFKVVANADQRIAADLAKSMLMESEIQPQKERVTAEQIQRIASELEGSLGGLYAPIAESQQEPVLRRAIHVLRKDKQLPTLARNDFIRARALTGIEALSRELSASRLLRFTQVIASLPDGIMYLRTPVLIELLARYNGIFENGLIKSEQQVAQERQQAMQQQLAMAAGEKAVDTAGNVVENQLKLSGAA